MQIRLNGCNQFNTTLCCLELLISVKLELFRARFCLLLSLLQWICTYVREKAKLAPVFLATSVLKYFNAI